MCRKRSRNSHMQWKLAYAKKDTEYMNIDASPGTLIHWEQYLWWWFSSLCKPFWESPNRSPAHSLSSTDSIKKAIRTKSNEMISNFDVCLVDVCFCLFIISPAYIHRNLRTQTPPHRLLGPMSLCSATRYRPAYMHDNDTLTHPLELDIEMTQTDAVTTWQQQTQSETSNIKKRKKNITHM